jgi:hypothetical protein
MSFDNRLIAARCIGRAWSLGEALFAECVIMEWPQLAQSGHFALITVAEIPLS